MPGILTALEELLAAGTAGELVSGMWWKHRSPVGNGVMLQERAQVRWKARPVLPRWNDPFSAHGKPTKCPCLSVLEPRSLGQTLSAAVSAARPAIAPPGHFQSRTSGISSPCL